LGNHDIKGRVSKSEKEKSLTIKQALESDPALSNTFISMAEVFITNVLLEGENKRDPIPWAHATIRKEFKRCYNKSCKCNSDRKNQRPTHGPYLYAYWKEKGKLKKKYIGTSVEEYKLKLNRMALNRKLGNNWTYSQWDKHEFIKLVAGCGSEMAKKYIEKLDIFGTHSSSTEDNILAKRPNIDWAYRRVRKVVHRDLELKRKVNAEIRKRIEQLHKH
jgi:hypothetical protein